ncbi:MAG: erythromycin esterase family protein, partial [Vicinamibacteria bacterium]
GIDGQIGGATGIYTQKQLGAEIAQVLIEPRRSACRANIDRLTSWQFDDDHPYGAAFKSDLNACLDDARMAAAGVKPANARVGLFATSLQSYVKFTDDDSFNQRDRLMYENLTSVLRSLPKQTKTVVWTANVHAPRVPHDGTKPTASYFDPQDRKSIKGIGIVGASGTYGRQGRKPTALEPASADSLEGMALAGGDAESNYLSARQLLAYDKLPSRLLGYGRYQSAEWSHLFDGVLVLKSERPPDFTRPPKPLPEASR